MREHTGFRVEEGAKVFIHQAFTGCPFGGVVTSRVHDYVVKNGCVVVDRPAIATVHVITTCGSDPEQAQLTFDAIEWVTREGPRRPVIVAGCLVSIDPERIAASLRGVEHTGLFDPRGMSGLDQVFHHPTVDFEDVPPSLRQRYAGATVPDPSRRACEFEASLRADGLTSASAIQALVAAVVPDDLLEKPYVPPDYLAWLAEHTERFARLLARRGPIALGRTPWRITRVWNDEVTEAVVLVVEGGEGSFELGLRRPDRPGYYMALSDRFAMWVKTPDYTPDALRGDAVKAVLAMLELRRRENTEVDIASSLVGRQG